MNISFDPLYMPFVEYLFLRKALLGCLGLALGCGPVGAFLVLRRMTLVGEAISHALLPGIGIAFLLFGFSLVAMSIGGLLASLAVAFLASFVSSHTSLYEDASFSGFYLISTAVGVLVLSIFGSQVDLFHILFGTVLAISRDVLFWILSTTTVTLAVFALIYRPLVIKTFDPLFFRSIDGREKMIDTLFLFLVVLNLISAFQALGTLMALGLLLIPAITARLIARQVWKLCLFSTGFAMLASYLGLVFSYYMNTPSGPMIVLIAGGFYVTTLLLKHVRYSKLAFLFGLLFYIPTTCLQAQTPAPPLLAVVTSFSILKDIVLNIGGEHVSVQTLVGPNQDPHVYEPTPRDIQKLSKADLIITNGLGLECWFDKLTQAATCEARVIKAAQDVPPRFVDAAGQVPDPHAWHSLDHVIHYYIPAITKALAQKAPTCAPQFQENAQCYIQKLRKLKTWIDKTVASIPRHRRRVLTNHDAFGYLGEAYGITFFAPLGLSTEGEPQIKTLIQLIQWGKKGGFSAVFLENISNGALAEQIAQETEVHVGGTLFSDALSHNNGPAPTYLRMIRHNMTTLVQGMKSTQKGNATTKAHG